MRTVCLFAMTCACGRIAFDHGGDDDRPARGTVGDARTGGDGATEVGACGTAFPGGAPCADWGGETYVDNATIVETAGVGLVITPNANVALGRGACSRTITYEPYGLAVEIVSVAPNTYARIVVSGDVDDGMYELVVTSGAISFSDSLGAILTSPYSPAAMRWARIQPQYDGHHAQVSADGVTWVEFALSGELLMNTAPSASIEGASGVSQASPGSVVYGRVRTCP